MDPKQEQQNHQGETTFTPSTSLFRRIILLSLFVLLIVSIIATLFVTQVLHRQSSLTPTVLRTQRAQTPIVLRSSVVTFQPTPHPSIVPISGKITEFALPSLGNLASGVVAGPVGITAGPHSTIWFAASGANKIGRITPPGSITEFALPSPYGTFNSGPSQIAAGPDGNLWFTSQNKIGRITPTGTISRFSIIGEPSDIIAGPDGNLWFTLPPENKIDRMSPSGSLTEFVLTSHTLVGDGPLGITTGPDGNVWFTESGANRIGRITPTGIIKEFMVPIPHNNAPSNYSGPGAITTGPDGNLWFTETDANPGGSFINKIGRMTLNGAITEFALPTPLSFSFPPPEITTGPDGNLWFTESQTNKIGRITPKGIITEFPVPAPHSRLGGITSSNNALWFTESGANKIGRLT